MTFSEVSGLGELALKVSISGGALLLTAVLWTILQQLVFKNPHEPPMVFHWLPVIGSTVTYGIDPLKFFAQCEKKVWPIHRSRYEHKLIGLPLSSMDQYLPLSFLARKPLFILDQKETISFSMQSIRMLMRKRYTPF